MYLAFSLLMTLWVVSDCSHFCHYHQGSLWPGLFVHLEHFCRQRCGLTVVEGLGPSLSTDTAGSCSTNTVTNSILTNSEKGVHALKFLPTVGIMNLLKMLQI